MAYAHELFKVALDLSGRPDQAALRRGVSTIYYALFHHLLWAATETLFQPEFRPRFSRIFGHGEMKKASETTRRELEPFVIRGKKTPDDFNLTVASSLYIIVDAFVRVQESREEADYNLQREWSVTEVLLLFGEASAAASIESAANRW